MLKQVLLAAAAVLIVTAGGCTSRLVDSETDVDLAFFETAQTVNYQTLGLDYVTLKESSMGNSWLTERRNEVLTDIEAFEAFWEELHANQSPRPDLPDVDFATEMVVAVVLGLRSSGGYAVEVKKVAEKGGKIGVLVEETAPGPSCGTFAAMTSPYHLIKMKQASVTPLEFVDTKKTIVCD